MIKTLLAMKLVFLLCTVAAMSVYASGYSQTITYSGKDVPLKNVFAVIRQQTGYSVFYNKKLLDHAQPVTVQASNMPLMDFLSRVLMNQRLNFRIDDKTIILSEKPVVKTVLIHSNDVEDVKQDKVITGKVTDDKGAALSGATVAVKGARASTLTKDDGTFSINVPEGSATLVITYVGMVTREVSVNDRSFFSISMAAVDKSMDDVIVVGYVSQKKSLSTGAIGNIKGSVIEDIPAPNIAGALRGRIAGLGVRSEGGRPGAGISLNVRNASKAESTVGVGGTDEPLYVIDGIIVGRSTFDMLDPSMVDEITILKDASAAIYGSAGAKGVVLITTKRGKPGPPKLSYNGYVGVSDATKKPEMLSAYDHAVLVNDYYKMINEKESKFFSEEDLEYLKGVNNKSWFDELWQPALTQRHNLSLSGGSESVTFFAGGSYQNENANYAGLKVDKYSFRSGMNTKFGSSLKAAVDFSADSRIKYSHNPINPTDQAFLEQLLRVPEWVPFSIDGKWVNYNSANKHPMGQIESGYYKSEKSGGYRVTGSLIFQPESGWLKGLTAKVQISQNGNSGQSSEYSPNYQVFEFKRTGNNGQLYTDTVSKVVDVLVGDKTRLKRSLNKSNGYAGNFTLQYTKQFGKHNASVLVGGEQSSSKGEDLGVYWQYQQVPGFDEHWAFNLAPVLDGAGISEGTKRSFFARYAYNYDNKYSLEGITRFDASSNFAKGRIWGVFPSVGLGWVVSQENFFRDKVPFINYLKLRTNIGLTGDDRIDERLWAERFQIESVGYLYNETLAPGLKQLLIANPDLSWEKKRIFNAGIDMAILNGKVNLGFEVFQNYNYDGFDKGNDKNFPMYAGFTAPVLNYRERYDWGTEYSIGYNATLAKDLRLKYSVNFGFSKSVDDRMFYNKNELWEKSGDQWMLDMGIDSRSKYKGTLGLTSLGMFRSQEEVDAFLAKNPNYTIDNKVPQPGWLYFKDTNGDGKIDAYDKAPMYDKPFALLSTSMQFGLTYKSLAFNINLAARFGGKVYFDTKVRRSKPSETQNVPAIWKDYWTPENPNGKFPRYDDPSMNAGWESTFWAVDGTTIRVNDMTLSYTVPANVSKRVGLKNVRVLATGNNLWVLKNPLKYKDPDTSYIYDYPTLRTTSVGLSLGL